MYLIVALLIPLHNLILKKCSKKTYIILTLLIYIVYEMLCHYGFFDNKLICYLFAYFIPCYLLITISKPIFENNKKTIIIGLISLILLLIIGFYLCKTTGYIQQTQTMKYPFRLYYLTYGIFISSLLIIITNNNRISNLLNNKLILFISSHSLWIYLWHILIIYIINRYNIKWYVKFIIVLSVSILITYIQSIFIKKIENDKNKKVIKLFKG